MGSGHTVDTILGSVNRNETVQALQHLGPLDSHLNVIVVMSNPCHFRRRAQLAREFIRRYSDFPGVHLYVAELRYDTRPFEITSSDNPKHLQLSATTPLWHKENLVNVAVAKLLPHDWRCFAWIDADIEFESASWVYDTLCILNGHKDIVQLWSHCDDMDKTGHTMKIFQSFGHQYTFGRLYASSGPNLWHPGYAWAMTRGAYEKIGGLYDLSILGSGDHNMAMALIGHKSMNPHTSIGYRQSLDVRRVAFSQLRLGYVPGVIRHHFHGSKKNRKYGDRWKILVKYMYDPSEHMEYNSDGILVPTAKCPKGLTDAVLRYFRERNEDE